MRPDSRVHAAATFLWSDPAAHASRLMDPWKPVARLQSIAVSGGLLSHRFLVMTHREMPYRTMRFVVLCLVFLRAAFCADSVHAISVDLTTFPDTGMPVPNGTVLNDQWRSIGILFDASPSNVDPIKDFGDSLFFDPDVFGAVALFSFVVPGTTIGADATSFSLRPFFNPGESAQLVGLDQMGNVVAFDEVTPADIGGMNQSITMSIVGSLRTVEWRTEGDPGIAANEIQFSLTRVTAAPALSHGLLVLGSLCLMSLGIIRLRQYP
jgi:hypothetical protein